jgi:hypothetical protein
MADIHLSRGQGLLHRSLYSHHGRWLTQAEIGPGGRAQSDTLTGSTRKQMSGDGAVHPAQ